MAKIVYSKKGIQASTANKSAVFGKIMENKNISRVINTAKEKREFYGALRSQALKEGGITKNTLKRTLGKLEDAKSFSKEERHILGKELVGGSASSRVLHEKSSTANTVKEKPKIDMGKVYREIMDKKRPNPNVLPVDAQKEDKPETKVLDFSASNSKLRNAEHLLAQADGHAIEGNNPFSVSGYIKIKDKSEEDIDNVKSILAKIQEKPDEDEKNDLAA